MTIRANTSTQLFAPPVLMPLTQTLVHIRKELLPWIAEKHLQYLDDRIHRIDELTDYLASCSEVEYERHEFISFVESWTHRKRPDLHEYLSLYAARFWQVRTRVDLICDRLVGRGEIWSGANTLKEFWREFALVNEIDSLHGMFLTSGRWDVNVVLPAVKELIFCMFCDEWPGTEEEAEERSYQVARRIITPCFAAPPENYDSSVERKFVRLFIPLLQYYDRDILFLFTELSPYRGKFRTIRDFVIDVRDCPQQYSAFLNHGVYPPFAWHELVGSRKPRREIASLEQVHGTIMSSVPDRFCERAERALQVFAIIKQYERNYNNYNYKGRFGLISKQFYRETFEILTNNDQDAFIDAILLDRFFDALRVVENAI